MRVRIIGLLAATLFTTTAARSGDIFYGGYAPFQIIRMDENGQNKMPLFAPGIASPDVARAADVSHTTYNTSFVQGRMWLFVPQDASQLRDVRVFAKGPNGQPVDRQVTDFVSSGVVAINPVHTWNNTR